ncbi:hypothetical protein HBZS_114780 [Helicobacter bizzozeronii CCUG 35545]|nr:hypothetical protein HBZS_114780 [Helicobacter bizzozeronii CCUG 35545]
MGYQEIAGGVGIPKWNRFLWMLGGGFILAIGFRGGVCQAK